MSEATDTELDPRRELAELVASTRALLEQYEGSGADMLVVADPASVAAFLGGQGAPHDVRQSLPQSLPRGRSDAGIRPAAGPAEAPARSGGHAPAPARPAPAAPPEAPARAAFRPPVDGAPVFQPPPAFQPPAARRPAEGAPPEHRAAPDAPHVEQRPHAPPHEPPREVASRANPPHASPEQAPPATRAEAPAPAAAAHAGPEGDDRRMRLALLAEEVRPCTRCPLCESRTQTVFARGNPFAELMFVGEGPGADEDAQGEPFVGAAGQLLDRMIAAMGYRRDDVYIANIVKCRPPKNRKPEPNEMEACVPYLHQQIALVKPKVLVALGATSVTGLIGATEGITRLRGKWKLYKGKIPVMPTFHPAYLLRTPAAKREVWSDLQEVMKHLGKPVPRAGAGRGEG